MHNLSIIILILFSRYLNCYNKLELNEKNAKQVHLDPFSSSNWVEVDNFELSSNHDGNIIWIKKFYIFKISF